MVVLALYFDSVPPLYFLKWNCYLTIISSFLIGLYGNSLLNSLMMLFYKAGKMDFKVGRPWNTEKYCWPPWLTDKKNFWILGTAEWLKQEHFDHGDCFLKFLLWNLFFFFNLFSFSPFATQKSGEWEGRGEVSPTLIWHLILEKKLSIKLWKQFYIISLLNSW